jgi:succinate dehydrogenase flavin-adding protein (antitoxin of CptAB toxin-antitoxin module)
MTKSHFAKEAIEAMNKAKKNSLSVLYRQKDGKIVSLDSDRIVYYWNGKKTTRDKKELSHLFRQLQDCEKIYHSKYGKTSPYSLALFKKSPAQFTERTIRAAEICTLKYALGVDGGGLNISKRATIIKGTHVFVWEHW